MNMDQIMEYLDDIVSTANNRTDPDTATLIEDLVDNIKTLIEDV
jgi:hypothetical protein